MSNIDQYKGNLTTRLAELRNGDPAYELQVAAVLDAVLFTCDYNRYTGPVRVLDVGTGLGFLAGELHRVGMHVTGIDVAREAIELARIEHPEVSFHVSPAETYAAVMKERGEEPYNCAVLNMVLHSVDDATAAAILAGVKECLTPDGTIILIVPMQRWIIRKLMEYAQDTGMKKKAGITWVDQQLQKPAIEMPIKIRDGEYWPFPITIYNRQWTAYAAMLAAAGFEFTIRAKTEKGEEIEEQLPYYIPWDYTTILELYYREKLVMVSNVKQSP